MTFFDYGETIDDSTEFVIFGIPWDYLTSIKAPDSAIAPGKIREVSKNLALTTEMGMEFLKFKAVDIGDIKVKNEDVEYNLNEIDKFIKHIYDKNDDIIIIMMGGDHFCSYPVIKAVGDQLKSKKDFGVLIFDAHLDLYEEWDKGVYSHATISHRVYNLEYVDNKNLMIVGTRDIDVPEKQIAEEENITYLNAYELGIKGLEDYGDQIINFFKSNGIKTLYISIDVDVLDPSIAPATGFAIPGGLTYRELWLILRKLAKNFNIIAFDIVEVAPNLDLPSNLTSNLAAKLIVELMSFIKSNE